MGAVGHDARPTMYVPVPYRYAGVCKRVSEKPVYLKASFREESF
jgi:hypothetical protein